MDRNMIVRAISGLFFITIVIGAIWWSQWTMVTLFGLIVLAGSFEFYKLKKVSNPQLKLWPLLLSALLFYVSILLSNHGFNYSNASIPGFSLSPYIPDYSRIIVTGIFIFILLLLTDLFNKEQNGFPNTTIGMFTVCYIALPFGLFVYLGIPPGFTSYQPDIIISFFILLWTNDTFAYLTGKFLGKNKLWERISPKKTWEGFFGGIIFTIIAALLITYFSEKYFNPLSIITALLVSIFATLGDLSESLMKRQAGVKDSGNIIPGHGGILDRFDGVLLTVPALFVVIYITDLF